MDAGIPTDAEPAAITRRRDLMELSLGYGLILLVLWTPRPWQRLLYCAAALFIATLTWRSFLSLRAVGLRLTNLLRSLWVVGLAVLVAAIILLASSRLHAIHPVGGPLLLAKRYWGYTLWAFLQQILLQDFFLRRLLHLMPGRRAAAVWTAAAMFAFAHLPSPILTALTLLWGYIACLLFLQYRNIVPLWIAHAILGITLSTAIPGPVIRNMRVGRGYLTYQDRRHPVAATLLPEKGQSLF
jgi:hypothetical protein